MAKKEMAMRKLLIPIAAAALAACSTVTEPQGGPSMPLVNATGQTIGSIRAWQTTGGISFHIDASGLPHGIHGVHVHSVGRCDPPDFASAGPHWNPAGKKHGMNNPDGPHAGDLPNIEVAANGVLGATLTLPNASLFAPPGSPGALLDADGAALVIHANADDYVTDPSGTVARASPAQSSVLRPNCGKPAPKRTIA
jgi:Cu-Zn family superoxide dismutase